MEIRKFSIKQHDSELKPIISKIPTPTYEFSKIINTIIKPYIPNNFSIKSSEEFIEIIKR